MSKPTKHTRYQSWMSPSKLVLIYLGKAALEHFERGLVFAADYAMPGLFKSYDELPPQPEDSLYFITTLFFFPLTILGGITGFSVAPIIYYSFIEKFPHYLMKPIHWIYNDKMVIIEFLQQFGHKYPASGGLYGLPGILLGSLVGLTVTSIIWLQRTIQSTYRVSYELFKFVTHQTLAFVNEQALRRHPFDQHNQSTFSSFEVMLGLFPVGWAFGLTVSILTFATLMVGLVIKHAILSFYTSLARLVNATVRDVKTEKTGKLEVYQLIPLQPQAESSTHPWEDRNPRQLVLGLVGRILGFTIGFALSILITIVRMILNIPEHVYQSFCRGARVMQTEGTDLYNFFSIARDDRTERARSLGFLGIFPLGFAAGILGFLTGGVLRVSVLIATTSMRIVKTLLNTNTDADENATLDEQVVFIDNSSSSSTVLQQLTTPSPSNKGENHLKSSPGSSSPRSSSPGIFSCCSSLFGMSSSKQYLPTDTSRSPFVKQA